MNPEEDEIYSFSHQVIIAQKCKVSLENLTSKDIDNIKDYLKPTVPGSDSSSSSTTSDADSELVKKSRKVSHRPMKQPSKARICAQNLIRECNKKIVSKKIPMMKVKVTRTTQRKHKQVPQPPHREDLDETNADSEDTVIYTPPPTPKPKKPVAKFIFRTVGIKMHRGTAAVAELKKQHTRKFKCYLCKQVHPTTKALNKHFKLEHGGLDCEECSKGFSSPLSLKKHSYMHKLCSHPCWHCDKKFPFKSQRDFHENVHTTPCFCCTRTGCKSSFTRDSDLKQHLAMHDADPLQCPNCDYRNPDIRNLRQHQRTHKGAKPYKCNVCDKRFTYSMQKKRHKCTSS